MPEPFAITAATNTLRLDDKRQAETLFSVFNSSGRQIRGRARIVPQNPVSERWLTLVGDAEKEFPIASTQEFGVHITVPTDAPAGNYPFRLDVVGVENPDEELSQGPSVTFEVPAPVVKKQSFPVWIPLVIVGVLILVGGLIAFLVLSGNNANKNREASDRATATAQANAAIAMANTTATAVASDSTAIAMANTTATALVVNSTAIAIANITTIAIANATSTAQANDAAATAVAVDSTAIAKGINTAMAIANSTATAQANDAAATALVANSTAIAIGVITAIAQANEATATAQDAHWARYNGTWIKSSNQSPGISKLEISNQGAMISVKVMGDKPFIQFFVGSSSVRSANLAYEPCNPPCELGTATIADPGDPLKVELLMPEGLTHILSITISPDRKTLNLENFAFIGGSSQWSQIADFEIQK